MQEREQLFTYNIASTLRRMQEYHHIKSLDK